MNRKGADSLDVDDCPKCGGDSRQSNPWHHIEGLRQRICSQCNYQWKTDGNYGRNPMDFGEPANWTGDAVIRIGQKESSDEDARDEWNDKMGVCLHDWQDDKLEIRGKGYYQSYDITAYCPTCNTTALIADIHYDSQDMTETFFLPGKLSASDFYDVSKRLNAVAFEHGREKWPSPPKRYYNAEGANPSGGATGDQIISWEHNGLSSPSGPPSDIMWAESDNFIWCAYCDDLITDDYYFTDGKTVHVDCNLKDSGDAETFAAHSLHRFTQKDSRPADIGVTRQKIKKEMFSEVSSLMTLKNLAVLTAAGMAGYLIAGRK
jgi:hypothetical protein